MRRVNADKRRYVSYFLRDWAGHPEVDALTPEDFNLGRVQLKEPDAHPRARGALGLGLDGELGLLQGPFDASTQINRRAEQEAHYLAGRDR